MSDSSSWQTVLARHNDIVMLRTSRHHESERQGSAKKRHDKGRRAAEDQCSPHACSLLSRHRSNRGGRSMTGGDVKR